MRAWVIRECRHGDPMQAMQIETVPVPEIAADEVLVEVMAAGINFNGVWLCLGQPVPLSKLKTGYDFHIPGSDASGIVRQVGSSVRRWQPGDEVVMHCNMTCGQCPACNGRDPMACTDQRIWGYETNWGSFAPFAKVQAQQLLPKPRHLTWEAAASYGLCLFTAYRMLVTRAQIRAGERVLIWGGAGGLGVFAIQLCRLHGAIPIAVVSSEEKAQFCRELGADCTINRSHFDLSTPEGIRDFGREIRAKTGGDDPDVVFEHVGQATFRASVYLCAKFGRIVLCGATSGYEVDFDVRHLWMRQKSILGSHFANSYEAECANRLVHQKQIRPVLSAVFAFERTAEAMTLQQAPHTGKMAVLVQAPSTGLGAAV
jgi:crotonyl-CoA carboxylase/reductase